MAWIIGLLTPLASAGIFSTMCVAWWKHAVVQGAPFVGKPPSYELALLYAAIAVLFMLCGPGRLSLDCVIAKWRSGMTARE
ncbi:MAG: DoxX family protein [candidate division Zixibacteria bacterium]|nr:DoxX family protein [candidate division Zixibacteria bacterium]